jgi:hypothetical protein
MMKIEQQDRVGMTPVQGMVIEVSDDNSDLVWIYRTIDGVRVEGGAFSFTDFLAHVDEFYNRFF